MIIHWNEICEENKMIEIDLSVYFLTKQTPTFYYYFFHLTPTTKWSSMIIVNLTLALGHLNLYTARDGKCFRDHKWAILWCTTVQEVGNTNIYSHFLSYISLHSDLNPMDLHRKNPHFDWPRPYNIT